MKILVLCEMIQATQLISFRFDQSLIPCNKQVEFKLYAWQDLKRLDSISRNQLFLDCEYLILSRWYRHRKVFEIINKVRQYGKKVFFHLDDFLFSVPKSIGIEKWRFYTSPKAVNDLYATVKLSDGIIASTRHLADEIKCILPNTNVLTCPYWKHFNPLKSLDSASNKRPYPVIGYMGTQTHAEDLQLITADLDHLMGINPSLMFETFGIKVPQILRAKYPDRCVMLNKVHNYHAFQSVLSTLGWWVGLAPLAQNDFNFCKTNTKFVEYVEAGIPVIASNYGPYEDIPTLNNFIDGPHSAWLQQIQTALLSNRQRNSLFEKQLQYCCQFTDPNLLVQFYREIAGRLS